MACITPYLKKFYTTASDKHRLPPHLRFLKVEGNDTITSWWYIIPLWQFHGISPCVYWHFSDIMSTSPTSLHLFHECRVRHVNFWNRRLVDETVLDTVLCMYRKWAVAYACHGSARVQHGGSRNMFANRIPPVMLNRLAPESAASCSII